MWDFRRLSTRRFVLREEPLSDRAVAESKQRTADAEGTAPVNAPEFAAWNANFWRGDMY
jgi:hypothetical protein